MPGRSDPRTGFLRWVRQDQAVNAGRRESQLILLWFRAAQWALANSGRGGKRFADVYRLLTSAFLSVELPAQAEVGPRLRLPHPHAVVLHPEVRIGADCMLRQGVTIGSTAGRDGGDGGVPVLGDDVELGAGCMVLGRVRVGSGARIGALALVLHDVPDGGVAVGNPARVVRVDESPRAWRAA
jgi:serine acetyltransferase